jgi:hypothetical protein
MLGIPIYLYLRWRRQRDRLPLQTEVVELPERALHRAALAADGSRV